MEKILLFHEIPHRRSFNRDADLIFGEGLQNRVQSVGSSDYAITKRYDQSLTVADPISRAGERYIKYKLNPQLGMGVGVHVVVG